MSAAIRLQSALLVAAFAEPREAESAWARWQTQSGWEQQLDFESYLLLPRVYHNLGGRGVDDALFLRLKGVVKRAWAANAQTRATLERVTGLFQANGIAVAVLPPCALLLHDRSAVLEADAPIALRVARAHARHATALLEAAGWASVAPGVPRWSLPGYIAASSRLRLQGKVHNAIDLHWVDQPMQVELHGSAAAPDHIRTLMTAPDMGSELVRLSRALLLLSQDSDSAGWHCLLTLLHSRESPFTDIVQGLSKREFTPDQTAAVATQVAAEIARPNDNSPAQTLRGRLGRPWNRYRALLGQEASTLRAVVFLPGYLMGKWQLQHPRQLPRRVWHALRYHARSRRENDT